MNMQYSESFGVPTGGWAGGANAIQLAISGAAGATVDVRLWRDQGLAGTSLNPLTRITMRPGDILPIKVKYISHNTTIAGFN